MHPVPRELHSNLDLSVGVSEIATELKHVCGILYWEYQSSHNTHRIKGKKSKKNQKTNPDENHHQIGAGKEGKQKTNP